MKKIFFISIIFGVLFCYSCSEPTTPENGGEPTPPRWLELTVKIDSLPAVNKTGSIQSNFIVKGLGDSMPIFYDTLQNTKDTLNYIRISFMPDPGRKSRTTMSGDTSWAGSVSFMDTIKLKTYFKPTATLDFIYFTTIGGYRVFDWATNILIGFYYKDTNGHLIGYFGNTDPSAPYNNAPYATLYINTKTGDTFLEIHAR